MSLSRRLSGLGALALVAASCTLLNPLDGYTGGVLDAGKDTATPDTSAPPPPPDVTEAAVACTPRVPPPRPEAADAESGSGRYFLAADMIEYGKADEGYDIDGLCTCPGTAACTLAAKPTPTCDEKDGVDNALGPLLVASLSLFPKNPGSGTTYIKAGVQTILIQLRGYNGTANDELVQVGILGSAGLAGIVAIGDGGAGPDGSVVDAGPLVPSLDGTDTWTIERDSVVEDGVGGYEPRNEDRNAYVRDGRLVATVDLDLRIGLFRARAKEARFTATLVRDGALVRLTNGLLSGRVQAGDLLTGLEVLRSPISNLPLCKEEVLYLEAKRRICEALDLPANRADDGHGAPCKAISLTLLFSAVTALPGQLASGARPRPCGDDWFDDCGR